MYSNSLINSQALFQRYVEGYTNKCYFCQFTDAIIEGIWEKVSDTSYKLRCGTWQCICINNEILEVNERCVKIDNITQIRINNGKYKLINRFIKGIIK